MWKKQKIWLLNKDKIKKWIKDNGIVDVIIFGSFTRGKTKPRDIDLCLVLKEDQEKDAIDLVDSLGKTVKEENIKFQITSLVENKFILRKDHLVKTLLEEGFSIRHNKELAEIYGFKSKVLFFYNLKNSKPSHRVRFHYLLRGRYGQKGLLSEIGAELLKEGLIEVPICFEDYLKEVLNEWVIDFKIRRALFSS